MATHRDLARALFLRDIGALRRVTIRQPVSDGSLFGLLALLGADVQIERHYDTVYFAEDAGLPTMIPLGMSMEATL
jgi:hypothetical protein